MPSPSPSSKRERLARFLSRFRSNRTSGSPLVVQTGFPTSLADLVVKNRAKFKKRKKHPQRSSDLDSPPSVAVRSEPVGSGNRLAPAVESPARIEPASVFAPLPTRRRGVGIGLGFLIVKVAALVVLAVGRKWALAGITALTFGLLILEVSGLLRPGSNERNSTAEGFDLRERRLVSPIREVGDHQNSECSDSNTDVLVQRRHLDAVVSDNIECSDIAGFSLRELVVSPVGGLKSENHRIERVSDVSVQSNGSSGNPEGLSCGGHLLLQSGVLDAAGNGMKNKESVNLYKSRRKKLFRKIFKRKVHEKKDGKGSNVSLDGSRDSSEVCEEEDCNEANDVKENSDEEFFSFEDDDNEVIGIDVEDSNVIRDSGNGIRIGRWKKLVFFVVVLLGLLGGKISALFFTVVCFLLSGYAGTVSKKWKMQ